MLLDGVHEGNAAVLVATHNRTSVELATDKMAKLGLVSVWRAWNVACGLRRVACGVWLAACVWRVARGLRRVVRLAARGLIEKVPC